MLNTSTKEAPNFMRISISSMKKSYLKITYQLLSTKLCDSPPDFIFSIYSHQAIDLIESKIYKKETTKKKRPKNVCSMFFENKGVEFINIARISCYPDITQLNIFLNHLLNFLCQWLLNKLTSPISTKFFNFNKFVNNLDLA